MDPGMRWRLSQGDPLDLPREPATDPLSTVLGSLVGMNVSGPGAIQ